MKFQKPTSTESAAAVEDAAVDERTERLAAAEPASATTSVAAPRAMEPINLGGLSGEAAAALNADYHDRDGLAAAGGGSVTLRVEYGKNGAKRFVVGSMVDGRAAPPSIYDAAPARGKAAG